jgi:hypothetical protein
MDKGTYSVKVRSLYKDMFYSCEKIAAHLMGVSEYITGMSEKK